MKRVIGLLKNRIDDLDYYQNTSFKKDNKSIKKEIEQLEKAIKILEYNKQQQIAEVSDSHYSKVLSTNDFIDFPVELEPVLANIEHINSLGKSNWYEVVYYDGKWRSYNGSKTFDDGEKVINWKYCKDCL